MDPSNEERDEQIILKISYRGSRLITLTLRYQD